MNAAARAAATGAMNVWTGIIPNSLPYRESYYVLDSDGAYMSLTDLTIQIFFRECETGASELTLSTADSTITKETLTDTNGNSVPSFRPSAVDVSALSGDYIADIVMTDASSVKHYWASGIVTFADHPASEA